MAQLELKIGDKTYNKAWVDNVSSTSQISSDAASVNYGVIPSTGNAKMRDINGQIRADIESGVLPVSNAPTKISINGNQIQEHITSDSDYNIIDKELNLQFSDRLSLLDKVTYAGMPLRGYSMTAYEMLDDVIGSYGDYAKEMPINWTKYQHKDAVTTMSGNRAIVVETGSGWEIIGTPIKVTPNKHYTINYSISTGSEYTTLAALNASGIPIQILKAYPTDTNCKDIAIATAYLSKTIAENVGTIEFTPTTDVVYMVLNFGWASDNQIITVALNAISVNGNSLAVATKNRCYEYLSGIGNVLATVGDKLWGITIKYPYLPQAAYRETIEKFCTLAQITLALDEDGKIQFYDARPILKSAQNSDVPTEVANSYKISNLNKTLFLKNKVDGVDIKQSKVKDEVVVATNIYNWDSTSEEYMKTTESATATDVKISITYFSGSITVPKKSDDNLEQMKRISDFKFSCTGIHSSGTVEKISTDSGSGYRFNYTSKQEETWVIEKFSESNASGSQTATLQNKFALNIADNGDSWLITFTIPASENYYYYEIYGGSTKSDLQDYDAKKLEVSLYGDKRVISFEEVDCSSNNIKNAVTPVSISTSELMQNLSDVEAIRDNILDDYSKGVPTATIDLFCGLGDWTNGEILQPNKIVSFTDEDGDWRVTGRTFKYQGAPTLSVELQKQTTVRVLNISKTDTTVTINRTSSPNHNASIGVITDKNFVYDGDVLSITVLSDNGCQLNTFTINRGADYASGQTTAVTQTYTVDGDVSIVAHSIATVAKYTLYILAGENTTVSVNRTSSQNPYASIGFIANRSAIYAGDSLSITVTANDGYKLSTFNINGESYLLGLDQTTARATYTVTSVVNIVTSVESLPSYKQTWSGEENVTRIVTTGNEGISDGTNTWYTGSATNTLTVADGYIQNSSYSTKITVMVDDTTTTYDLTSSRIEIANGTSALGNTKTRVYATLTSSGISIVTETQSTSANSKAISAVICYITKIEQYY